MSDGSILSQPVQTALPHLPDKQLAQSSEIKFPLLCCYETGKSSWRQVTDDHWRRPRSLSVDYVLGPLTVGERRKIFEFLGAAANIICLTISRGGHKAYATRPGNADLPLFILTTGTGLAGFASRSIVDDSIEIGYASFSTADAKYWALSLAVAIENESSDDPSGYTYPAAVDVTINANPSEGDDGPERGWIYEPPD